MFRRLIPSWFTNMLKSNNEKIEFDWRYIVLPDKQTKIFRPIIPIKVKTKKDYWRSFNFLVDTGADLTMLPDYMKDVLDINMDNS